MLEDSKGRKIILSDIDGVMLDWMGGFSKWLNARFGWVEKPGSEIYYSVMDRFAELNNVSTVIELVTQFNNSDEFGQLEYFADAESGVNLLRERMGDKVVIVPVTQIGNTPRSRALRQKNLTDRFGADLFDFNLMYTFDLSEGKHRAFTRWQDSGILFIDDHAKHCQDAHEHGIHTFMFGTTYNLDDSIGGVRRVNCWEDWVDAIEYNMFREEYEV